METHEIARFESAGDVRRMILQEGDGYVTVRQDVSGPSALIAYGEESRSLRATFAPEAVRGLLGIVGDAGRESLRAFLEDGEKDIVDLMDLCDARGVSYAFTGVGPASGIQFRPAPID